MVFFHASGFLPLLFPWRFHIAENFAEMFATGQHRFQRRQRAYHILLLWLGREAIISFFDDLLNIGVRPEASILRHCQILTLLQREIVFLNGL